MVRWQNDGFAVRIEHNGYVLRVIVVLSMLMPYSGGSEAGDVAANPPGSLQGSQS